MKLTTQDLQTTFASLTRPITCHARFTSPVVGGVAAEREGIEQFVTHHLHLIGEEAQAATDRIMREELGERPIPSDEGELKEKLTYGVAVIRRDEHGPYLGNWMVKACLKQAASRLGLFMSKRGSKGDMAEMGLVMAHGVSLFSGSIPDRIYLRAPGGVLPAPTAFESFKGRVSTPQGSTSICTDREVAAAGTEFGFEFRLYGQSKLTTKDLISVFAAAQNMGLGSAKAFERGKFEIVEMEIADKKDGDKDGDKEVEAAA